MLSDQDLTGAIGATAYGTDGGEIGRVEHFFLDDRTGDPTWVAVATGLFGTRHSILPAAEATVTDRGLQVPVVRETVLGAPALEPGDHLEPAEEAELRRHYGLPGGDRAADGPAADRTTGDGTAGDAMIRSEEQLRVSMQQVPTGRARVVKYVVTEEIQVTVPVRREELRIEELPVDTPDDDAALVTEEALAGPTEAEAGLPEEIILYREVPVVDVRVEPVERVRLGIRTVEEQHRIDGQVRRERIAVDEDPVAPAEPS